MSSKFKNKSISCPSYPAKKGAYLIGVKDNKNKVSFLSDKIRLDEAFIKTVKENGSEANFRFSGNCLNNACLQWEEGNCSLAGIVARLNKTEVSNKISCAIKTTCRWFQQEGNRACNACPEVFYDLQLD